MPVRYDPTTPPYRGFEGRTIHPELLSLFLTYGPAFSPDSLANTTLTNKRKMGIALAAHRTLIHRMYVFNCTSSGAAALIHTLVCLAVELGNMGHLDLKPWGTLIRKFGVKSDMRIGKRFTLTPHCGWFQGLQTRAPRNFASADFIIPPMQGDNVPSYWLE